MQCAAPLLFAVFCTLNAQAAENPNYSNALYRGASPDAFLADIETRLNSKVGRIVSLSYAAKVALEAGQFQKAGDYAIESLQVANSRAASRHSQRHNPRDRPGIREADFYGNFVLGRLALRDGDIRAAGTYLLASGKTAGDAVLSTYGPNMSLAYELLKTGDPQSVEEVSQFLQECREFWRSPLLENWITGVQQNQLPDFGDQLYR